ncbi:hypothetical protein AB0N65_12790 [Paenarthrobacter sp. NPDC089322]|uniref:hypothetical protein n=1 Tax=Paenarthrobacter sp. NPDC089322 TaxID=3155065 RepID=UPI003413E8B1
MTDKDMATLPPSTPRKPRFSLRTAIIALILGCLWLLLFHNAPPPEGTVAGQGTVVDQEISSKGLCEPIADVVVDGITHRTPPGTSAEPCAYEIGESIDVTYHPDDVAGTLEIPLEGSSKNAVAMLPLVGVMLLIGGLISLVGNILYRRRTKA